MKMTQETMDARTANGAGALICANCQKQIEIGQEFDWNGHKYGGTYSHPQCMAATPAKQHAAKMRNYYDREDY